MRVNRGDEIAGLDALRLRAYFRRYGDDINWRTLRQEFSLTKAQAENVLDALVNVKMISRCEFQHDKKMMCYETTIQGNALGMAKASRPVKRESAEPVSRPTAWQTTNAVASASVSRTRLLVQALRSPR